MKLRLFLLLMTLPIIANATVRINGIVYDLDTDSKTAKVTRSFGCTGDIVIPESIDYEGTNYTVNCIDEWAFNGCAGLTSISIPNSVTSIMYQAFDGCTGLSSLTIPSSVIKVGTDAFANCTGLTSVIILCSPTEITTVGAFMGCSNLKEITFDCEVVTGLFYGLRTVEKVNLTEKVTTINDGVFELFTSMSNVVIPNSVTTIGRRAFRGCSALISLTIPTKVESIGDEAFAYCKSISHVEVLCSLNSYGKDIFVGCNNLQEVSFDCEKVTPLFKNVSTIEKINLTENVTSIGMQAFYGCSNLGSVKLPQRLTNIDRQAFAGCSEIKSIVIPNSVTYIGWGAFQGCGNLTSVVIGSGVTSIDGEAFNSFNIKKMIWLTNTPPTGSYYTRATVNYVSNDNFGSLSNTVIYPFLSSYFELDGIIYVPVSPYERTCAAIDCVYDTSSEKTKISPMVTYKGVTMNVLKVQPYVCFNNTYIKNLKCEMEGEIPEYAFAGCKNAQTIVLGNYVCEVETPGCYIGSNISKIGNYAFDNCKFKNLIIDNREEELTLGSNGSTPLFSSCPLDSVYIGGNITYSTSSNDGYSPFYRNLFLRTVLVTDKETEISENEFYGCNNLQNFTIGEGVSRFGNYAFSGCSSLKELSFGSKLKSVGIEAFSDCSSVTNIISRAIIPPKCETQALDDINKWNCKLYVPMGCLSSYQQTEQWKEFFFIEEQNELSSINNPKTEGHRIVKYYSIDGRCGSQAKEGLNIILLNDGSTKKIIIK